MYQESFKNIKLRTKSKKTSINLRSLVIFYRHKGKTYREIGEMFQKSISTIQYICQRYYEEDGIEDKPTKGDRRILTRDMNDLY